jgi:hypothetical protein
MSIVVTTTLALILAPAVTTVWFIQRRKRTARQRRRSPLTTSLLRAPGQTLRDKIEDMRIDVGMETMLLMVVPMFPLAFFQIHAQVTGRLTSIWLLSVVAIPTLVFVAHQIRKLIKASAEMDKLRLGLDGEIAVGQELQQLMLDGALVFHDLPAECFNIDHVVVAQQGVFAIETKGYSKPNREGGAEDATVVYDGKSLTLPDRSGSRAIDQTQRQAKWLAAWLTGPQESRSMWFRFSQCRAGSSIERVLVRSAC